MKPTLVDNCEHYNRTTHVCDKCGRGLPDVCFEFEEMKKKAAAFEEQALVSEEQPKRRGRKPKATDVNKENTTD